VDVEKSSCKKNTESENFLFLSILVVSKFFPEKISGHSRLLFSLGPSLSLSS